MKNCPACAKQIQDDASKCAFCGAEVSGVTLMEPKVAPVALPAPSTQGVRSQARWRWLLLGLGMLSFYDACGACVTSGDGGYVGISMVLLWLGSLVVAPATFVIWLVRRKAPSGRQWLARWVAASAAFAISLLGVGVITVRSAAGKASPAASPGPGVAPTVVAPSREKTAPLAPQDPAQVLAYSAETEARVLELAPQRLRWHAAKHADKGWNPDFKVASSKVLYARKTPNAGSFFVALLTLDDNKQSEWLVALKLQADGSPVFSDEWSICSLALYPRTDENVRLDVMMCINSNDALLK